VDVARWAEVAACDRRRIQAHRGGRHAADLAGRSCGGLRQPQVSRRNARAVAADRRRLDEGGRSWVAWGAVGIHNLPTVWTSQDGTRWALALDATAFKDTTVRCLMALDAGFVAVGFSGEEPGTTCGTGEPVIGHTWTSTDGSTWREMPHEGQFNRAVLYALYARNDTL
jgi:hypothetical protein